MQILQVPINDLKDADYNPRKMTEKQVTDLTASLTQFGFVEPIVVNKYPDRLNVVVGGHQRLKVARLMGMTEVPVFYVELPLEAEKRLNLRLNRNNGEWDWDLLANHFDNDVLLEVGFEKNDLNIFDIQEDDFEEGEGGNGQVNHTKIRLGDVFVLGNHRLMCGDSTSSEDVGKLMAGQKARMLFTDPPYGVNYVKQGTAEKHDKIKNDELTGENLENFLTSCFEHARAHTTDDATFYSWFANSTHKEFRNAMEKAGWKYSHILIWIKNRFVLSRGDYHHAYEPCMYGWKEGFTHYSNPRMRSFDDVLLLDKETFTDQLDAWFVSRDDVAKYKHPTQKPVRISERALKMSTQLGDGVLDLFAGSGGVMLACEQSGRKFYGMELDQKYVALILNRWADFTGKDPVRESDGATWSVIKA